jgi:hypothetical protein
LVAGALYYNSTDGVMKVYDGGTWIAASAASQAIMVEYEYTATAGQTTFTGADDNALTLSYTAGSIIVTLNGVVLDASDYTASNGNSVVLAVGASAGDELNVRAFSTFDIANHYTQAQADALLAAKASLTGTETLTNKTIQSSTIQGGALTLATAVASTSGTSIDFTSIPSWVKRITVMFSEVSTNGTSAPQIQLGDSGGFETSGYLGSSTGVTNTNVSSEVFTSGFGIGGGTGFWAGTVIVSGAVSISLLNASNNTWAASGIVSRSDATATTYLAAGAKSLSATLDRVRITTVNGTDAFDAGTINIMYEG